MMINEEKVIEIVRSSLKLDSDSISINSSSENVDEWNSLEPKSVSKSVSRLSPKLFRWMWVVALDTWLRLPANVNLQLGPVAG